MDNELIKSCEAKAQTWLASSVYDAETQAEVQKMLDSEDKTELIEGFYKNLEFGTGGLRGIMGVGTNRMNIYTVGAATQGLSNYLNKAFKDKEQISVVVGHHIFIECNHHVNSTPTTIILFTQKPFYNHYSCSSSKHDSSSLPPYFKIGLPFRSS